MSYLINNQQKLNEIIFANRNKAYGAYAIRSSYGETVFRSLGMMIFGVGTIFGTAYYMSHKNDPNQLIDPLTIHDSVYVIPVYFPPEEIKKPEETRIPKPAQPITKSTNNALSTNIVDSTRLEKTDTTLNLTSITKTVTELNTNQNATISNSTSTNSSLTTNTKTSGQVKGILEVDTQPEFEGGLPALYRFISSHLKYPSRASEYEQQGKVHVRFVVDESGKVGDLVLLNNIGYGMDEEALRVVSMIPKFKTPAKVNGEAVKVYYQVPIRFNYR